MTRGWRRRETMGWQRWQDGRSSCRREARTAAIAKPTPGNVPTKGHPHLHEHGLGTRVSDMQDRCLTRQWWRFTQVVRSWGSTS